VRTQATAHPFTDTAFKILWIANVVNCLVFVQNNTKTRLKWVSIKVH
jgi:hypothetical protein